jgi:hypothetical protein
MSATAMNTKGATWVAWMVAAGDQAWSDRFIALAIERGGYAPELLTTWPLLQRHESGATVGVWLLVAAAEKEADAREFISARREMEPDCALEIAYTWPSRPGTREPQARGFQVEHGWLAVFPSPLMREGA